MFMLVKDGNRKIAVNIENIAYLVDNGSFGTDIVLINNKVYRVEEQFNSILNKLTLLTANENIRKLFNIDEMIEKYKQEYGTQA